jgi:hypothetical protein
LPASGSIGSALNTGVAFSLIAISPTHFALVVAADTGQVMILQPGATLTALGGAANPDLIAISPSGTSATLWFPLSGQLEAVTGLPGTPSIRTISAAFLNASPLALAISDDGQWVTGLWPTGVYAFGPNQAIPLQTDPGVVALAFFHNNHNLALATSTRAIQIADVGGSTQTSVLYDYSAQPLSPRAIALSFDNSLAVVADSTGQLVDINVAASSANIVNCHCAPTGLYALGGALFRLNGTNPAGRGGPVIELKIFDASAGAVWIVPPALSTAGGRQ